MKVFILQHPDGKYLDTNYHGRYTRGIWCDKPRLYKSKQGVRSAYGLPSPAFDRVIGPPPPRVPGRWTDDHWAARRAYHAAMKTIKLDQYFALLAEDGYKLIEKEIKV